MDIMQVQHVMLNDQAHSRLDHDPKFTRGSAFAGKYCALEEASIPLLDLGFRHADAAYDVVSASKGYMFRLEDHLERFESSCERFRLKNPYSKKRTVEILTDLVKLAGTREAYIWWCVTRGSLRAGEEHGHPESYENRFYAYVVPYRFIADDALRASGMDLLVSRKYIRIPEKAVDPAAKNFHWMDLQLAHFEARDEGFDFPVLCDADGNLTEAPGANIFLVKNGELFTPDAGCLEGITRKTTLELAEEVGMPIRVEQVHADQLRNADEAFITSTAGGIMPINTVDGRLLGAVAGPGSWTTRLHNLYWTKRWDGWHGTLVNYDEPAAASA